MRGCRLQICSSCWRSGWRRFSPVFWPPWQASAERLSSYPCWCGPSVSATRYQSSRSSRSLATDPACWFNRRDLVWPVAGWFALGAVPLAVLGGLLFAAAPAPFLTRVLGAFLLAGRRLSTHAVRAGRADRAAGIRWAGGRRRLRLSAHGHRGTVRGAVLPELWLAGCRVHWNRGRYGA